MGSNRYKITLSSYPTLALTAVSYGDGGEVKFNTYTGATNQLWYFEEVTTPANSYESMGWIWPIYSGTSYSITCGYQGYAGHHGLDIGRMSEGTLVRSAASGQVVVAFDNLNYGGNENWGCGYAIAVRTNNTDPVTGNRLIYMYQHLYEAPKDRDDTILTTSHTVGPGVQIGKVGNTGNSTGPHLHMQVTNNGSWHHNDDYSQSIDPALFYPSYVSTYSTGVELSAYGAIGKVTAEPMLSYEDVNKYYVDTSIIAEVGEENYENWKVAMYKSGEELTVAKLLTDFNISASQFAALTQNSLLDYNVSYIMSNYSVDNAVTQ